MAEKPEKKETETKKLTKKPSALKRTLQNEKRRVRRKSFNSQIKTSIQSFKNAVTEKLDTDTVTSRLNQVYSLLDKAVNKRVIKKNTSSRTKSRLSAFKI